MTKSIEVSTDIKINIKGTAHVLSKDEANALYQCLKQELGLKDTFTNPTTPTWPGTGKWPYDLWYCHGKDTGDVKFPCSAVTETYTFNKA